MFRDEFATRNFNCCQLTAHSTQGEIHRPSLTSSGRMVQKLIRFRGPRLRLLHFLQCPPKSPPTQNPRGISMETTFDYLRTHATELGSRILETYPPLQSPKDLVPPGFTPLLRKALPARRLPSL